MEEAFAGTAGEAPGKPKSEVSHGAVCWVHVVPRWVTSQRDHEKAKRAGIAATG